MCSFLVQCKGPGGNLRRSHLSELNLIHVSMQSGEVPCEFQLCGKCVWLCYTLEHAHGASKIYVTDISVVKAISPVPPGKPTPCASVTSQCTQGS